MIMSGEILIGTVSSRTDGAVMFLKEAESACDDILKDETIGIDSISRECIRTSLKEAIKRIKSIAEKVELIK